MNRMNRMVVPLMAAGLVLGGVNLASAAVINPTDVQTSSDFFAAATGDPANSSTPLLIDPANLDADNLHIVDPFGSWLADGLVEPIPVDEQWAYVDLGLGDNGFGYDLTTLRIWNYHERAPEGVETSGRSVAAFTLFMGSDGATTPVGPTAAPFSSATGWSFVRNGVFAPGPLAAIPNETPLLAATDTFDLTGENFVRYIGIEIDTNVDGGALVGLGHIQAEGTPSVPEPGGLALMVLAGLVATGFRRVAPRRR